MSYKSYWLALSIVIIGSFAVLGSVGRKMISEAPPKGKAANPAGEAASFLASPVHAENEWLDLK